MDMAVIFLDFLYNIFVNNILEIVMKLEFFYIYIGNNNLINLLDKNFEKMIHVTFLVTELRIEEIYFVIDFIL